MNKETFKYIFQNIIAKHTAKLTTRGVTFCIGAV